MLSGDRNKWLDDNSSISFFHEYIESKHSQSKLHWKRGFGKYSRRSRSINRKVLRKVYFCGLHMTGCSIQSDYRDQWSHHVRDFWSWRCNRRISKCCVCIIIKRDWGAGSNPGQRGQNLEKGHFHLTWQTSDDQRRLARTHYASRSQNFNVFVFRIWAV